MRKVEWFEKVWSKGPGNPLKKPAVLIERQFRAQLVAETRKLRKESRARLAVIAGGLTSQPALTSES